MAKFKLLNIGCQDNNRALPIHYASLKGHIDVVKYLVSHGADIECYDKDGFTPLLRGQFETTH